MVATLISTAFMGLLLFAGWSIIHDLTRPLDLAHRDVSCCDHAIYGATVVARSSQPMQYFATTRASQATATPQFAPHALAA